MKQACVDTSKIDFQLTIANNCSFWNSFLWCASCLACCTGFFLRIKLFWQCFNTIFCFFDDICCDTLYTCVCIHHTLSVSLNQHWQVKTGDDSHFTIRIFSLNTACLVKWWPTPKVSQYKNLIIGIKLPNSIVEVFIEVVWTFVWHESHHLNFLLLTENHRTWLMNTFSKFTVAGNNNTNTHVFSSFIFFLKATLLLSLLEKIKLFLKKFLELIHCNPFHVFFQVFLQDFFLCLVYIFYIHTLPLTDYFFNTYTILYSQTLHKKTLSVWGTQCFFYILLRVK